MPVTPLPSHAKEKFCAKEGMASKHLAPHHLQVTFMGKLDQAAFASQDKEAQAYLAMRATQICRLYMFTALPRLLKCLEAQ